MDQELLKLKDIHLPHAIPMWLTAPGWITLYLLAVAVLLYSCIHWYLRYKRRYTVKFALKKLKQLQDLSLHNSDNINIALEISTLIRRTALHYFRRDEIAGLAGNSWLEFLNRSGNTAQFTTPSGKLLIDAPYRQPTQADIAPLFALAQTWLRAIGKHKQKVKER